MWPVSDLDELLPESFRAFEDDDFLEIRCTRCGWRATFSALGVRTEEALGFAREHEDACPMRDRR